MRFLALVLAWLLATSPALAVANQQTTTGAGHPLASTGTTYTGPGDIVASATAWYGLRAYNSAYRGSKAINVRRASDNTTQDINVLAGTGALDIASANTFAGTDATCTGTISTTTLTCASASSTPHAGSTLTGTGITQPSYIVSCGTFTGGAGTCTLNASQTVSVGETITMQYGLYVTKAYDQTGGGKDISQATAANQFQLLPNCGNSLPCMNGAQNQYLTGTVTAPAQPFTATFVSERTGAFTTYGRLNDWGTGAVPSLLYNNATNGMNAFAGNNAVVTVSDSVLHSITWVLNGASSNLYVDGSSNAINSGADVATTSMAIGADTTGGLPITGYLQEGGYWSGSFTGTQATNMCHNQRLYWSTTGSC